MKNIKINELGEKTDNRYQCKVCKREVDLKKAQKEEWYYKIKQNKKTSYFFNEKEVEYLCNEHFNSLPSSKKKDYVIISYPYFISTLIDNKNNISTY